MHCKYHMALITWFATLEHIFAGLRGFVGGYR